MSKELFWMPSDGKAKLNPVYDPMEPKANTKNVVSSNRKSNQTRKEKLHDRIQPF